MAKFPHDALCRTLVQEGRAEHDLWHPLREDGPQADQARSYCRACPVRGECLEVALESPVEGIWGATDTETRRLLRLALGRNVPVSTR